MSQGLSVGDIVNVDIVMSPLAAALRNFGALLILGSTPNVIDTTERLREYSGIDQVAQDFGTAAPEYLAADAYFSQSPQPSTLYIGAYAQTATAGRLLGGKLSAAQQSLTNFTAVTSGSLSLMIDGSAETLTLVDLSAATNLNGVASDITAALAGAATCTWDATNDRFVITSASSGSTSSVAFATDAGTGTDLAPLMLLRSTDGGRSAVGSAIETAVAGITACAAASSDWYGHTSAPVTAWTDQENEDVAAFIEAANPSRINGITTQNSAAIDPAQTTDIASVLQSSKYRRTFVQYSSSSKYAAASLFGRAFTVDFGGNNTTITLKFKQEPGISAETLTETAAATLAAKNCNVFVNYNNSTAIIQEGKMCDGSYFDEVQGLDWTQNNLQTAIYDLLYTSPTKIPQTDAGVNQIVATAEGAMDQAVSNGLIAPGTWNAPGFGAIVQGQTLSKGYYVYAPRVAMQSQADREARKAPTIQIAAKLAGAVHSANVVINVNR